MVFSYLLTLEGSMGTAMNCHLSHLVLGLGLICPVSAEWSGIWTGGQLHKDGETAGGEDRAGIMAGIYFLGPLFRFTGAHCHFCELLAETSQFFVYLQ